MPAKTARPNILFITCDQWRADSFGAAGHPVVKTPNVDRLAAEGVLFRRHYAGAAPCSPARACLYTGLYQMNNRVCRNGTPLDARHDTLALGARRAGYDPTLFGYTDTSPDPRALPPADPALSSYEGVLPGFTVRQLLPEHQKPWLSWLAARGIDSSPGYPAIHRPARPDAPEVSNAPPVYSEHETPGAFLAGEFIRWLSEQDRGKPWFAHLSFLSPHPPYIVPAPFNTLYDPDATLPFARARDLEAEAAIHPYVAFGQQRQKKSKFLPGAKGKVRDWTDRDFRVIRAIYHGMISETDRQLGRIFDAVRAAGTWDETVVVVTSDHAEMMGDHFSLGKGGFFDGSYHVPLVVRDPRARKRGISVDHFTEAVDLFPTMIELMSLPVPPQLDGRSLKPFLDGQAPADWRDAACWEYDFRSIAKGHAERHFGIRSEQCNLAVLRTPTHKYVHFGGGLAPVLFDLVEDPGETRNIANEKKSLRIRLELAERLLAWRAEHLDRSLSLLELTDDGLVGAGAGRLAAI